MVCAIIVTSASARRSALVPNRPPKPEPMTTTRWRVRSGACWAMTCLPSGGGARRCDALRGRFIRPAPGLLGQHRERRLVRSRPSTGTGGRARENSCGPVVWPRSVGEHESREVCPPTDHPGTIVPLNKPALALDPDPRSVQEARRWVASAVPASSVATTWWSAPSSASPSSSPTRSCTPRPHHRAGARHRRAPAGRGVRRVAPAPRCSPSTPTDELDDLLATFGSRTRHRRDVRGRVGCGDRAGRQVRVVRARPRAPPGQLPAGRGVPRRRRRDPPLGRRRDRCQRQRRHDPHRRPPGPPGRRHEAALPRAAARAPAAVAGPSGGLPAGPRPHRGVHPLRAVVPVLVGTQVRRRRSSAATTTFDLRLDLNPRPPP